MNPIVGWLPYGSSDLSVFLCLPLTSSVSAANFGYTTRTTYPTAAGSTRELTHDSTFGMKGRDSTNTGAGYRFQTVLSTTNARTGNAWTTDYAAWGEEGQMCFEIESTWIAYNSLESTGHTPTGAETLFLATGYAQAVQLLKNANGTFQVRIGSSAYANNAFHGNSHTGTQNSGLYTHTAAHRNRFVKVNIGWTSAPNGGQFFVAVDGLILARGTRTAGTGSWFSELWWLVVNSGAADTAPGYFVRNLQFAKRAPVFPSSVRVGRISTLSDSILDYAAGCVVNYSDATINQEIDRTLQSQGVTMCGYTSSENGGYTIENGVPGASGWLGTVRAAVLAQAPKHVLIQGGTNDTGGAAFSAAYLDHLEYFFGVNSYTANKNRPNFVFLMTIPQGSGKTTASVLDINNRVKALVATWDAAYPSLAGKVKLIDVWNALHGGSVAVGTTYYADTLHLNAVGNSLVGRLIGDAIAAVT